MKAPVIWLKDFTDIDVSAKELGDALTDMLRLHIKVFFIVKAWSG